MMLFVVALGLFLAGGAVSLLGNRNDRFARTAGAAGAWSGAFAALAGVVQQYHAGFPGGNGDLSAPDAAGCFFLVPILILGGAAALHAIGYLEHSGKGRYGIFFAGFNAMLASMLLVTMANSPVWFLLAWELMGITSFALVAFEYHEQPVMKASWIYLLAGHAGAGLLMLMFLAISLQMPAPVIFALAAAGFGLKAGFPLLHIWLPEAHPAAPAPVSAVMSGGMINLGIYGLLHFGMPAGAALTPAYGIVLVVCGMIGALVGILPALAQDNLKRLLAFSSVENMGIITMGIGFGFLGMATDCDTMSCFGFCGALLHIWNHAMLKGTLFLAAGEVLRSTGTLEIDRLGGLMKKLPVTGKLFTGAGIALSGLPPFNAFLSEFLLYAAALTGVSQLRGGALAVSLLTLPVLAMVGALACGAYTKAIGGVFLGEPRSELAMQATPTPRSVQVALLILAELSFLLLGGAPWIAALLQPVMPVRVDAGEMILTMELLNKVVLVSCTVLALTFLFFFRRRIFRKTITWDCGYAAPTARMEYTGTAMTQPLCDYARWITGYCRHVVRPAGLFPQKASASVEGKDPGVALVWQPVCRIFTAAADKIHILQSGYLHFYILLIVLGLAAMLCWGWFRGTGSAETVRPAAVSELAGGVR
ncbi:MAG: hypothetical protein J6R85_04755 [Lentisphaeria bacterium]|nr:hypothetical protein [Lentisphaeria bacterium]